MKTISCQTAIAALLFKPGAQKAAAEPSDRELAIDVNVSRACIIL